MKKILVVLMIFLTFSFGGCSLIDNNKLDKETLELKNEFRENLVGLIEDFGDPQYWDDDFDYNTSFQHLAGNSSIYIITEDKEIAYIYFDGSIFLIFDVVCDSYAELTRNETAVWNVMITYMDLDNELYIDLDYYFYDSIWHSDFDNLIIPYSFNEVERMFKLFNIEDYQYILSELGYDDIVNPIVVGDD